VGVVTGDVDDDVDAAGIGDLASWPKPVAEEVARVVDDWETRGKVGRLWAGDSSLWTGADEGQWLGWLHILDQQRNNSELDAISTVALGGAFDDVLVLGMGGSSLCPEVLGLSFGRLSEAPRLHVLDSTDPAQIRSCAERLAVTRTLFIASSKSGTTLESNILLRFFLDRVSRSAASETAGHYFLAVTDPGSELERFAIEKQFRMVFHGVPSIGGRYSALSHFGMVPACAMGIDVARLLARAERMRTRCGEGVPVRQNPGAMLGLALGAAARTGHDKMTFIASPGLRSLGTWVEQLVAESTGKNGQGIVPVDGEVPAAPDAYGGDRLFIYVRDEVAADATQDEALSRLREAGFPVLLMSVGDPYDLGAEFFRWEFATAVAGAVLQVNPFDQPDVEASKAETRRLINVYETAGHLPDEFAVCVDSDAGLSVFADDHNAAAIGADGSDFAGIIGAHCRRLDDGDYFAILAYLEMSDMHTTVLQQLRHVIRDATGSATCLQFGPRFLHSTGQVYKGGLNSGVFLQITCEDLEDIGVPGHRYTFGVVKAAQARGDLAVLGERRRRAIRVHIKGEVEVGLERLATIVRQGLGRSA